MVQVLDGKVVFGPFAIPQERVSEFVAYVVRKGEEWGRLLMCHQPDSHAFMMTWCDLEEEIPATFETMQFQFCKEVMQ